MTTGIKNWSTTPGSNNAAVPNGAPEGWAPSAVNAVQRQVMAEVRAWYEDAAWVDFGHSGLTYVDATNFRVTGDKTAIYHVGRRVRAIGTAPFTIYGRISATSYSSPNTTVTVVWDSGSLGASLSEVAVGSPVTGYPIPYGGISIPDGSVAWAALANKMFDISSKTANYTVTTSDRNKFFLCAPASANITMTLPSAATAGSGFIIAFKKTNANAYTVTLDLDSTDTIDASTTNPVLSAQNDVICFESDGTNWVILFKTVYAGPPRRTYKTSGSGNFTVPAGVTTVRCTIAGAGGGAASGGGSDGTRGGTGGDTTVTYSATTYTGAGGIGGLWTTGTSNGITMATGTNGDINIPGGGAQGGARGHNGNNSVSDGYPGGLCIKDLTVTPGDTIAYSVGSGGTGLSDGGVTGADGSSGYIIFEY